MSLSPTEHRTIVVVDVADFTNPSRNVSHLFAVHEGLYGVLKAAFAGAGVDLGHCAIEDRGDGALILVPPTVSKSELADKLPDRLVAEVRRYNSTKVEAARLKLRVALHAGDIRKNAHGWVGHAVNLAFRILDAEDAKAALRSSGGVVAMIASDYFYSEVIFQDPGSAPESYNRIDVSVKTFTGHAWLRLHGGNAFAPPSQAVAVPAPVGPASVALVPDTGAQVLGLLSEDELKDLHGLLADVDTSQLPMLVSRAVGSVVPVPRCGSVWDAFLYLTDINAGPDGIPPAIAFLELLGADVGGETGADLLARAEQRIRLLRRAGARPELEAAPISVHDDLVLHLMIAIEPDGIDADRCVLSFWRQDDPLEWPPVRGGVDEIAITELEQRIDDLIIEAEGAWSGQAIPVALEIVVPRSLLGLPITTWCKERRSGEPRPLVYDYALTLRSLERMRASHWHRSWRMRWDSVVNGSFSAERIHPYGSVQSKENSIDAVLSESRWVGLVMDEPPSARPDPSAGPDPLTAALRAGLPLILWHPAADAEDLRALVAWLVGGQDGVLGLPGRRREAHLSAAAGDLVRDLVVLLEDPNRTVVPGEPSARQ